MTDRHQIELEVHRRFDDDSRAELPQLDDPLRNELTPFAGSASTYTCHEQHQQELNQHQEQLQVRYAGDRLQCGYHPKRMTSAS